jgi:hypothetical protein
VVPAPPQPIIPLPRLDPTLDPGPEAVGRAEPAPTRLGAPLRRRLAHVRQRHVPDPSRSFSAEAIPRSAASRRGATEPLAMVRQGVAQVRLVLAPSLFEDRVAGDDPAFDLVEPQLAAELG